MSMSTAELEHEAHYDWLCLQHGSLMAHAMIDGQSECHFETMFAADEQRPFTPINLDQPATATQCAHKAAHTHGVLTMLTNIGESTPFYIAADPTPFIRRRDREAIPQHTEHHMAKTIHTDNFGSDYPNEKFVTELPERLTETQAQVICEAINAVAHAGYGESGGPRHYCVVADDYQLQPGFEP